MIKSLMLFVVFASVSAFLSPDQIVKDMINAVYIPETTIEIEGVDHDGTPYSLRYNRKTGILTEIIDETEKDIPGDEIEPFLRLFFFKADHNKPESFQVVLKDMVNMFEKLNIDKEKRAFSVSEADGRITVAIGKSKRFEKTDNIQFYRDTNLPASLETGDRKILFSQYHKSVLPLVFPGRIDIFKDGELSSSVFFLREEYRQ